MAGVMDDAGPEPEDASLGDPPARPTGATIDPAEVPPAHAVATEPDEVTALGHRETTAASDHAETLDVNNPHPWPWTLPRPTDKALPPAVSAVERLRDGPPSDRIAGWLTTISITALAFVIRLVNLGHPKGLVFDETYYAKDAYSLLLFGYERNWPATANDSIVAGDVNVYGKDAAFIVHPPVGKWLIAVGEHLFGMNSFGWRVSALVFGTLLIAVTIRLGRRLSRSTLIGGLAGLLLTVDGLAFVLSRTALLDIFQAFFLVAAVSCVVADRDWFRHRLADWIEPRGGSLEGLAGPWIFRPWLVASGVLFGLAVGTKWNSVFVLGACGVLVVVWSVAARHLAGARRRAWFALLADGAPAFASMVVLAVPVYISTWAGWLATQGGYDRGWGASNPQHWTVHLLGKPLASLLRYHEEIYGFHTGSFINGQTHPYQANPAGWLIMARPLGIDAVNDIKPGIDGCPGPENCLRVISAAGTPLLWWAAAIALVAALVWWVAGRDWRFGVPVIAALATYLPWFNYATRPLFYFYAITIIPFTCIILAMAMGVVLGPPGVSQRRRRGAIAVGSLTGLIVLNFAFIYPILTDEVLPYGHWMWRMWFVSWI